MKQITICILALILITTLSCDKNKNNTDTAYFSCYIDGQFFEPEKQQGLGEYPITAKLLDGGIDFRIDVSKGLQNIFLWVKDSNKVLSKPYELFNTPSYYSRATYDNNTATNEYTTNAMNSGIIELKMIDNLNQTVQGTFYFDAYNSVLNDTIHITNGKFKLKYSIH